MLQLAVEGAVRDTPGVKSTLDAVRKIARVMRTPSITRQLKREGKAIPVLDVNTRWGSTFDMLASVERVKPFMTEIKELANVALSEAEWSRVNDILESLRPAREATVQLQENQLLVGDFYGIWLKCKMRTSKVDSNLAKAVVANMEIRERARVNKKNERTLPPLFDYPGFAAALFMDPRYFSVLTDEEVKIAKIFLSKLWSRMKRAEHLNFRENPQESSAIDPVEDISNDEDDIHLELQNFIRTKDKERYSSYEAPGMDIMPLLDAYIKETKTLPLKADVLQYWEQQRLLMPQLYQVAMTVLAIPTTQVSVERLFSIVGFILDPLRVNLDNAILDDILVLNSNAHLVKNMSPEIAITPAGSVGIDSVSQPSTPSILESTDDNFSSVDSPAS